MNTELQEQDGDFTEIPTERANVPAIMDTDIISLAEQAEKRLEALNKIKKMALKVTNRNDWVDENGKPYLQASGAEKVGRVFGISWRIYEPVLENLDGGHFCYTYKGEFSLGGATIEAIGTRSSKDGFFKKYTYEGTGDNKKRIELPPSEIDRGDVKKSAFTNLLGNGITRILGIRNLTYEDLKEFAGISKDQMVSVEYKTNKTTSTTKPKTEQSASAPVQSTGGKGDASDAQVRFICKLLSDIGVTESDARHETVSAMLGLSETIDSLNDLSKTQANTLIKKLQEGAK
jgi:hypothetical protein